MKSMRRAWDQDDWHEESKKHKGRDHEIYMKRSWDLNDKSIWFTLKDHEIYMKRGKDRHKEIIWLRQREHDIYMKR